MDLVIVESPTKAKTIGRFLGAKYRVESSYGHIRDLPKGSLGIDVENGFAPQYVIPTKSRKRVNELKRIADSADRVILATDEDREGEAIAWHLAEALGLSGGAQREVEGTGGARGGAARRKRGKESPGGAEVNKVSRIVFHEITERAISESLKEPRGLNMHLVLAQQARRILDRLVGYKLSPFLWKKIMGRLSAGRVQSAALRLIVERERAIRAFTPVTYFTVEADIEARDGERAIFALPKTRLEKINGKPIGKPGILSDTDADAIVADLKNDAKLSWKDIERRDVRRSSAPPFTTSAMQQEAARRLGFSAAFTMRVAQSLYEEGYITYMRTDSVNLSQESLAAARAWIEKQLGSRYAAEAPRVFRTKSRLAQEAHEAIRPTNPSLSPETVPADQNGKRLYELIWQRFMASQLPHAIFEATRLDIEARGTSGAAYTLRATGTRLVFDGFLRLYPTQFEENELPRVLGTEAIALVDARSLRHETQPLPRFNDASLIKALEENGIGRPSTYAPTIAVLEERRYTTREQDRRFHPTEIGEMVTDLLTEHFPEIADIQFTAALEEKLDRIADGKDAWNEVIRNFYLPFEKRLTEKYEEVTKRATSEKTDEACEKCGKPMLIRLGRFGRFMACSGFPECKNTKPLPSGGHEANGAENGSGAIPCPQCGEGQVTRKRTKRGRFFYGCTRYPECDFASWKKVEPAHAPPRE